MIYWDETISGSTNSRYVISGRIVVTAGFTDFSSGNQPVPTRTPRPRREVTITHRIERPKLRFEELRKAAERILAAVIYLRELERFTVLEFWRWLHARAPMFVSRAPRKSRACSLASAYRARGPPLGGSP